MDFFKALIPGSLLTFTVCTLIGKGGSRGGWLHIQKYHVMDTTVFWSWALFVIATVLAWALFAITPK